MSQENVELFHKALEGYNRRDIEAMLEIWHPKAEWYPFTAQVEGDDAYHGHEGLRQWWANVDATFEELEASVEEVRDLGDAVLDRDEAVVSDGDPMGVATQVLQDARRPAERWLGVPHPVPGAQVPQPCAPCVRASEGSAVAGEP